MNTNDFSRFLRNTAMGALFAGLWLGMALQSNASDQDDYAQKISQAHLFSQSVMWVGTTPPDFTETSDLYVAMGLDPDRKVDRIRNIEGFILAHPDSPWTPSLRANLARYYRTVGRYSVALDYWQKAWDATKDLNDPKARKVADYTLAYWTDLLSSLGRVDKLKELIAAVGGRPLSTPQFQRMFDLANKAAGIMVAQPGQSFRCGNVALYHVARTLDPQGDFSSLLELDSPATGFSIAQLEDLSDQYNVGLVAVKRPSGSELVVPSVVHWKETHYAAIVEKENGAYKVVDPTFGRPQTLDAKTINENASGYFLVPTNQVPKTWQVVPKSEAKTIFGKGLFDAGNPPPPVPYCDADGNPCTTGNCTNKCPPGAGGGGNGAAGGGDGAGGGCSGCLFSTFFGMPDWQVREPYISLWLHDRPMFYNMSFGQQFVLQVDYHQRELEDGRYDTNFGNLGINWNCNLLTYIKVDGTATVGTDYQTNSYDGTNYITPVPYSTGGFEATEYSPDGGQRVFDWGGTNVSALVEPITRVQFIPSMAYQAVTNFNFPTVGNGFIGNNEYYLSNSLVYPNGSVAYFDFVITNSLYPFETYALITSATDPHGHVMTYTYSNNSGAIVLSQLVDFDGKTNRFIYGNASFPSVITEVTNISYGLAVHFAYDTNGFLSNIVDMAGITSSFQYMYTNDVYYTNDGNGNAFPEATNSVWLLTEMTTPYGNTTFDYFQPTWPLFGITLNNYIGRAITVTQPDSGKQLFMFHNDHPAAGSFPPLLSGVGNSSSAADFTANWNQFDANSIIPVLTLNGEGSDYDIFQEDTYYWGARQYAALSTNVLTNLVYSDFIGGRLRNWLHADANNTVSVGQTLNIEQEPSPDPLSGAPSAGSIWYAYEGRADNDYESTNDGLPAGFGYALQYGGACYLNNISRNSLGYPTEVVAFGTDVNDNATLTTNQYVYAANGIDLTTNIDPYGVVQQSYTYDGNHNVTSIKDALNETTTYTYNNNGQITSISRPTGLVTTNIYGANGFLATTYDYDGSTYYGTNTYTYTNGLILTHTDERGMTTTNTWDALHRITKVGYPDGTSMSYTYNNLDLVKVVDRLGYTTSYAYDNMRRRTAITNALTNVTVYGYCACGSLDSITDAQGKTTTFQYDNTGQLTNTLYPDGFSVSRSYDLRGNILNITDSSGKSTDKFYDGLVRVVAISNDVPYNARVLAAAYGYDLNDLVTNQVDANGVSINMAYDPLHRLATRSYPDGGTEHFGYTANVSGMTSYTNQLGNVWTYAYDPRGSKTNEIALNVYTNGFGYSRAGDLLSLTDGNGNATSWNYDHFGRVTNKLDASNDVIFVYGYDANNRLTSRWTPVTSNTVYAYDAVGNLTNVNYQQSPAIHFGYDSLNRLVNMVDAVGTTVYTYDFVGQLLSEDGPWADDTVNYTYANRLRTSLSVNAPNASSWTQSYEYDPLDRLTNVTSAAGTFEYYYGVNPTTSVMLPGSLIQSLNLPNGAYITNTFDGNARLTQTALQNSSGANIDAESYTYNLGNQRTEQTFTAGNYMNYTYDSIGELQTALGKEPGGVTNRWHEQFGYTYDAAGNLNQRTNNGLDTFFGVNNLNELHTVAHSGTLTAEGTTTSLATNVTVNTSNAVLYVDSTFASTNQPLVNSQTNVFTAVAQDSYGRVSTNVSQAYFTLHEMPSYDLNGNMVSETTPLGRNFAYDDENQLIAVWVTNTWMSQFTYDGQMRRRTLTNYTWTGSSWLPTNAVHYIYDGNVVIQERDENNLPQVTYTRGTDSSGSLQGAGGIGGLLARTANPSSINPQLSASATAFYHADGNGNITCLINTNQFVVAKYEYDPYGNILSQIGSLADANVYRFSSKEYQMSSGLVYYLYRYYEPNLQRWINRDPIQEKGGRNLYEFVADSPVTVYDSFGLVSPVDPWPPSPPPSNPNPIGFAICQRSIQADGSCDCSTSIANCCGGEHTYIQYIQNLPPGFVGPPSLWGFGWGGGSKKPSPEKAFRPTSCQTCKKGSGTLTYGSGAGKPGSSATDGEIQDCIKNVKPSQPYKPLGYNCRSWALEAAQKCGLDCN